MRRITFDLDGTLCTEPPDGNYEMAKPIVDRIRRVAAHYADGDYIVIDTGRHANWRDLTERQCAFWNIPYHELHVGRKPHAHCYVDATAVSADDFFAGHAERWPDEYFAERTGGDARRQSAFNYERMFLVRHDVLRSGLTHPMRVCDVGCSTGEFAEATGLLGPPTDGHRVYGMEINSHARALAEQRGISFDRDILNSSAFFDLVVFRGTIQHLPRPFTYLARAYTALKPGGHVAILSTPNTGSLVYRMFQRFAPPLSDDARNYWMPSAAQLSNALVNLGFEIVAVDYPYRDAGYDRPLHDALGFARRLLLGQWTSFAWPGNLMNVIARKP